MVKTLRQTTLAARRVRCEHRRVMVSAPDRSVMRWLCCFCAVVAALIMFGGFVRLTRSGLSIVEWDPVTGVIPPIGEGGWAQAFAEYRRSPEFLKVNSSMTLAEFQQIYLIEWLHRLVARMAGFAYAIPLFVFIARRRIPRCDLPAYLAMGSLFVVQAIAGWVMVASGLDDRPSVSHFNLTVHLLLAFLLLGLTLWAALEHRQGLTAPTHAPDEVPASGTRPPRWSTSSRVVAGLLAVLLVQIAYGGFTAGLKAGHVSDTWPQMLGAYVPAGLLRSATDLVESPATIVFVHRWFAFATAAAAVVAAVVVRRRTDPASRRTTTALVVLIGAQILLGIATVLSSVDTAIALAHQATAIALFSVTVLLMHRSRCLDGIDVTDQPTPGTGFLFRTTEVEEK